MHVRAQVEAEELRDQLWRFRNQGTWPESNFWFLVFPGSSN